MQRNSRVKLFAMITGIMLMSGIMQSYADGSAASTFNVDNRAEGARIWANNCSRCHNLRPASEFTAKNWHLIMQHMRIQAGLTGQEARAVFEFLASQSPTSQASIVNPQNTVQLTGNTATDATRATTKSSASKGSSGQSGSATYHKTCIACHGANGKGSIPGAPDFTSSKGPLSKSDSVLLQHTINGYNAMPARGGNSKLTNDDLKNSISYIRSAFAK